MIFVGLSLALFALGAVFSRRAFSGYAFAALGAACALAAGVLGLLGLIDGNATIMLGQQPLGLGIDHLSAIFLTISSVVWLLVALFGLRYGDQFRRSATVGFNLALMGITIVVTAIDAVSFLVGWELMTMFVFLMLLERSPSERPPFGFLAFGELSTVALVIGFAALYGQRHSITLGAAGGAGAVFFVFASLGMVIKMDIVPFHAWMRNVYEHIPGHIAAIASVSVTLAGVYGLERTVQMSGYLQWWALVLLSLGAVSAFWGALQAASTRGLRSLPAYSTVESNGMILAAVGLSVIAAAGGGDSLAYLARFALAAALVLAIGHALAKSLFFLSLGQVAEVLQTRTIGETRSVWVGVGKVPALGIIVSGLSFAAFPPLVGYVGEWMLLQTTFQAYKFPAFAERFVTAFVGILVALALGLMAFSMVKFIGYTVLGREKKVPAPMPSASPWITAPQICLMILVAFAGIALPLVLPFFGFSGLFSGLLGVPSGLLLVSGEPVFGVVSPTMLAVVLLALGAIPAIAWVAGKRGVRRVGPWNGGIELAPSESFSAPAYSQILQAMLKNFFRTHETEEEGGRRIATVDLLARPFGFLWKAFSRVGSALSRAVMNGKIAAYVSYVVVMFVIAILLAAIA
jgi:hydrogenase-4 component B